MRQQFRASLSADNYRIIEAVTLLTTRAAKEYPRNVIRIVFGAQLLLEGLTMDSSRHASGLVLRCRQQRHAVSKGRSVPGGLHSQSRGT